MLKQISISLSCPVKIILLNQAPPSNPLSSCLLSHPSLSLICADGACKHLLALNLCPDLIVGDMDSIDQNTLDYFQKQKAVRIFRDYAQDSNDFEKCLETLGQGEQVWVFGALGGRFDHTIQNINLMYKYADKIQIRIVDQHSLITTILPGTTEYEINEEFELKDGCGFVSFVPQNLTTQGFQWNIIDNEPEILFGKFISSSNKIINKKVTFINSEKLMFITQLKQNISQENI